MLSGLWMAYRGGCRARREAMKKMLILVAMLAMLAGRLFGEGSALSDAQVRFALNWIYSCFDGDHQNDLNALFEQDMGYDTNQFVRVAKEMAEADEYIAPERR